MITKSSLTRNERNVLSELVDSARKSDSEIAQAAGMTPQGVRKIRLKLEKEYIREYRTVIDYEKLGIGVFAIVQARIRNRQVLSDRHIIGAFEVNESRVTHILILGFGSIEELDEYKRRIAQQAEIQKINIVSKLGFLKNSPKDLIKSRLVQKKG